MSKVKRENVFVGEEVVVPNNGELTRTIGTDLGVFLSGWLLSRGKYRRGCREWRVCRRGGKICRIVRRITSFLSIFIEKLIGDILRAVCPVRHLIDNDKRAIASNGHGLYLAFYVRVVFDWPSLHVERVA